MTTKNPFLEYLEPEPKATYFSYGDQWGAGQRQQGFYQKSFTDLYNQYLGTLGKQIRSGQAPTSTWNDYLGGFDFNDWYRQQNSPEQRNPERSAFAPQTRWDVLRR